MLETFEKLTSASSAWVRVGWEQTRLVHAVRLIGELNREQQAPTAGVCGS